MVSSVKLMLLWGIGIGGADGVGIEVSFLLVHFFQMSMPIRKMASVIPIMVAGDVNVWLA